MNFNINIGQAGTLILSDGRKINYGAIRIDQEPSKLVFYTGAGLREMFRKNMTQQERERAWQLKELDENQLMKLGYVAEILLSDIIEVN